MKKFLILIMYHKFEYEFSKKKKYFCFIYYIESLLNYVYAMPFINLILYCFECKWNILNPQKKKIF